jgi:hypothetical protein
MDSFGGAVPELSMAADSRAPRTECGIGALLPWADRLWALTYPSHGPETGSGTGLYEITPDFEMREHPESVVTTSANRMVHHATDQAIIGPHVVDADGTVRTLEDLLSGPDGEPNRLTATMEHLHEPERLVYVLTMEGLLYEADLTSLSVELLADLNDELDVPDAPESSHFKGGHTANGRVTVTNNTFYEPEMRGERSAGRLGEWDGEEWTVVSEAPHLEAAGRKNMGAATFATGWDRRSALLDVRVGGEWRRYRLPKGSRTFDHGWQTEWPRIREVETERFLLDLHGTFFELSPVSYDGQIHGVRPVSTHLRVIPDFCSFRGCLVLAGNQTTPMNETNPVVGQPQSGLYVGATDDLWAFGDPQGWGAVWQDTAVEAGVPSDPYLMTGYDDKVLHLEHESGERVTFAVEVDYRGDGSWATYGEFEVPPAGYRHHEFPAAFSAHWVRVRADRDCEATASFTYS